MEDHGVYDTCDAVRKKSLEFMVQNAMSKAAFLREIGGVNSNSWLRFSTNKSQFKGHNPGAGNSAYPKAYYFLEKVRIARGGKKGKARLDAEAKYPPKPEGDGDNDDDDDVVGGYRLRNDNGMRWTIG